MFMTNRQHLRGLSKLRRPLVQPARHEFAPEIEVRDLYGDKIPGVVAYRVLETPEDPFDSLEFLGSGCFSKVFALDKNRVIKRSKGVDQGFDAFSILCMLNPHNPYLPTIYYRGKWGTDMVYVMERLRKPECEKTADKFNMTIHLLRDGIANQFVQCVDPMLAEAVSKIGEPIKPACENWLDLKYDNTMQREDGTLVIVDPWVRAQ